MHLLKIREAALALGCHPFSLYGAIYEGRVKAVKFKGNLRVKADDVEELLVRREKMRSRLSVREVSRILDCSTSTVLRLIHKRMLPAELSGKSYWIDPAKLEEYVLSLPNV
ncbi:helix-turn-helix domain-containing protein [candidate division WOR-3 bacterium]|nr:helix-turn-helix domain-containing protein [candidate division WOR-3 bacterium]